MEEHNLSVATSVSTNETDNINNGDVDNKDSGVRVKTRHNKRSNSKIANNKTVKDRKSERLSRLTSEVSAKKADLDRGYLIVPVDDSIQDGKVKHLQLDSTSKMIIKSVIAEKELEIYDLKKEIEDIDAELKTLASTKTGSMKDKLKRRKKEDKENKIQSRIDTEVGKAAGNGTGLLIQEIKNQMTEGKKDEAYASLKKFLSQEIKPIAKQLDQDKELEKKIIIRTLEKLEKA